MIVHIYLPMSTFKNWFLNFFGLLLFKIMRFYAPKFKPMLFFGSIILNYCNTPSMKWSVEFTLSANF